MVAKTRSQQLTKNRNETISTKLNNGDCIDDQWSADLMDMVKFAKYNKGYKYVLVVIDVHQNTCGCGH